MPETIVYRPHPESPARAAFRVGEPRTAPGQEPRCFEFVSRGDFVTGALLLPLALEARPAPLVFVSLADGQSMSLADAAFAEEWVRLGFALAAIDLPLHGRRSSPKLSERLREGLGRLMRGDRLDLDTRALVEEFARQSTSDLLRGIDAIAALPEIDASRIAVMGIDVGAITSTYALAADPGERLRAAVLCLRAATVSDPELDPAAELSRRGADSPCAIQVQALGGDTSDTSDSSEKTSGHSSGSPSRSLARSVYEAAGNPKEWASFDLANDAAGELPIDAVGAAREFLSKSLGL